MNYNRYLLLLMILFIVDLIECLPASNEKRSPYTSLEQSITKMGLMARLKALQDIADNNQNNRRAGTKGHQDTLEYIASSLESAGYKPRLQKLELNRVDTIGHTLNINDIHDQLSAYQVTLVYDSPATPDEGIVGQLVFVGDGCGSYDASTLNKLHSPWIAVATDGKCLLLVKAIQAQDLGASAILIYGNSVHDESSDKPFKASIPAGTISTKPDTKLLDIIRQPSVLVGKLSTRTTITPITTYNIIAETKTGNRSNVVMMGVHSDSIQEGPGINDDGSGLVAALEIATHINQRTLVNAVRFCWWTAEEEGAKGSKAYMERLTSQEKQEIAMYLNADMIGSPNYVNMVYDGNETQAPNGIDPAPRGSLAIQKAFERYFDENNQAHQLLGLQVTEQRSDAHPFYDAKIPVGGVSTGFANIKTEAEQKAYGGQIGVAHDPCYHRSCDTLKNVNTTGLLLHTRAYAHLIEIYSQSTASILT